MRSHCVEKCVRERMGQQGAGRRRKSRGESSSSDELPHSRRFSPVDLGDDLFEPSNQAPEKVMYHHLKKIMQAGWLPAAPSDRLGRCDVSCLRS